MPVVLTKSPAWPEQMRCENCGFFGYMWLGVSMIAYEKLFKNHTVGKCSKCGCGILDIGGQLPIYILK